MICSERSALESDLLEAYSMYADDEKFVELYERYSELFKKPVSLGNKEGEDNDFSGPDNDGASNFEDIGDFGKISLDDFGKDSSQGEKEVNSQGEKGADVQTLQEKGPFRTFSCDAFLTSVLKTHLI